MQDVLYSPNDPIFFLHHAMVDKIFATWQSCHGHDINPGPTVPPALYEQNFIELDHGFDTPMLEYEEQGITARKVNVIELVGADGYVYSADRMEAGADWSSLGNCKTRVDVSRSVRTDKSVDDIESHVFRSFANDSSVYVAPTKKLEYEEIFDTSDKEQKSILNVATRCSAIYERANKERPSMDNGEVMRHARVLECTMFHSYGPLDSYWKQRMGITGVTLPCENYKGSGVP